MAVGLDEWGAVGGDVGGGGRGCATPSPRAMDVCHIFTLPPSCPKCEMAEPRDLAGPYHGHGEKAQRGGKGLDGGGGGGGGLRFSIVGPRPISQSYGLCG